LSGSSAPLSSFILPDWRRLRELACYATQLGTPVSFLDQFRRYAFIQQYSIDMEHDAAFPDGLQDRLRGSQGAEPTNKYYGTTGYNINQLPDQYMNVTLSSSIEHLLDGHRSRLRTCAMLLGRGLKQP